jgi:hypothetical protein
MNIIFIFLIYVICRLIKKSRMNGVEASQFIEMDKNEDLKIYYIMVIFSFYLFFSPFYIKELKSFFHNRKKINQLYVSNSVTFFENTLLEKYKLKEYCDRTKPAFFFGVYDKKDIDMITKHKSTRIVIFTGGDILLTKENINKINKLVKLDNIYFVCISSFIIKNLNKLRIPYKFIPINHVDPLFYKPVEKGNAIYIYTSIRFKEKYGYSFYKKITTLFKDIRFILATNPKDYDKAKESGLSTDGFITCRTKEDLFNIYKQCFLGFRFTEHDGCSNTVIELGLMGIKCVHNGCQPSAVNYKTITDIVNIVKREKENIGSIDNSLHNETRAYDDIGTKWKSTMFYAKNDCIEDKYFKCIRPS